MTVGELREELANYPDHATVEIMATHEWRVFLQGLAADKPKDGRFSRVLLLAAGATPWRMRRYEDDPLDPIGTDRRWP